MQVIFETGRDDLAKVYVAETTTRKRIEFAESLQPPFSLSDKWVLTISTLHGCPVRCNFCDAGGWYRGKLSADEIIEQVDYLVSRRFPSGHVPVKKFKVQFARVGEPSMNPSVIDALVVLSSRFDAPGLHASLSTVAPSRCSGFFEKLIDVKDRHYSDGHFQLQFSIHTTNRELRDKIIPIAKWDFTQIAEYGHRFYHAGSDRKVVLNFALEKSYPFERDVLLRYFDPEIFFIKITPLNPTVRVADNNLVSYIDHTSQDEIDSMVGELNGSGYDVLVSIGEREENLIGSNCGQYLQRSFLTSEMLSSRK